MYDKTYSPGSVPSEHTIYFTVELYNEPNKVFLSSKMTTQIKNFNDLGQDVIEFPVKIKDLSIMALKTVRASSYSADAGVTTVPRSAFSSWERLVS